MTAFLELGPANRILPSIKILDRLADNADPIFFEWNDKGRLLSRIIDSQHIATAEYEWKPPRTERTEAPSATHTFEIQSRVFRDFLRKVGRDNVYLEIVDVRRVIFHAGIERLHTKLHWGINFPGWPAKENYTVTASIERQDFLQAMHRVRSMIGPDSLSRAPFGFFISYRKTAIDPEIYYGAQVSEDDWPFETAIDIHGEKDGKTFSGYSMEWIAMAEKIPSRLFQIQFGHCTPIQFTVTDDAGGTLRLAVAPISPEYYSARPGTVSGTALEEIPA